MDGERKELTKEKGSLRERRGKKDFLEKGATPTTFGGGGKDSDKGKKKKGTTGT